MNSSLPGRTSLIYSALAALGCAMVATLIIQRFQLDLTLAQWIYALEGHEWTLKEHWLFSELLHRRGRQFSIALLLLCLVLLCVSCIHPHLRPHRRVLAYLVISPLIASGAILLGKHLLGVECP
jgi:membrane-associated PAP2 superfamily phosphatase